MNCFKMACLNYKSSKVPMPVGPAIGRTEVTYIIPNTVEIKKRSSGLINNSSFDGKITYKVNYIANVCKPVDNIIVECIVTSIDKSQIICYIDDKKTSPLEIYLFKHNHQGSDEFLNLKEGDIINVKIGGSKSQHKDTQIVCIAQYIDKV